MEYPQRELFNHWKRNEIESPPVMKHNSDQVVKGDRENGKQDEGTRATKEKYFFDIHCYPLYKR